MKTGISKESRKAGKTLDELISFCEFWEWQIPKLCSEISQLTQEVEHRKIEIWKLKERIEMLTKPDRYTQEQIAARNLAQMKEAAYKLKQKQKKRRKK